MASPCCIRIPVVLAFLIMVGISALAQTYVVQGVIKDNNSLEPVSNVNIIVNGTNDGVFSDRDGRFSLTLKRIPSSITLSCVGYEPLYFEIDNIPEKPLELILRQSAYTLQEIDINATRYSYVYKDREYSIQDYEIMDDRLLLLVFRYQLKYSELVLLTMNGDTITISPVPEQKPKCLFKDFLGNIHYISTKGSSFQCYYNELVKKIEFPFTSTYDSLLRTVKPFLFSTGNRFYFQEFTPDGMGTNYGYYDTAHHKKYFQVKQDEKARKSFADDVRFYNRWNDALLANQESISSPDVPDNKSQSTLNTSHLGMLPLVSGTDLQANKTFNYHRINAPLIKLGDDEMAVFNFTEGIIEFMSLEGKVYRTVPITFQKEKDGNLLAGLLGVFVPFSEWEWSGKIYIDGYFRDVYTTFIKQGMVQIRKIDLETGKLVRTFNVPFSFPEKIEIYQGNSYFLIKESAEDFGKWRLGKLKM